jgi:hypothetical protein
MSVQDLNDEGDTVVERDGGDTESSVGARDGRMVDLSNSWPVKILGIVSWLIITALNLVSLCFVFITYEPDY